MALSTIQNNSFADTAVHGFRNILVNGGLIVSQRGDYTSATSYSGETYYLDRWKMWQASVSGTVQQTTVTINGVTKKAMKIVATSSATGFIGTRQKIELQNIPVGVNLVASCWVRSNNAYTRFRYNDFGGSDANSPVFTNDGNWEKVSFSIDSSSTTVNPSIGLITYDTGMVSVTSGDYIEFTDFQLEISSGSPTPFEHRPFGDELARCQRYFQKWEGSNTLGAGLWFSANQVLGDFRFIKPMRTSPTISVSSADFCKAYLAAGSSNSNDSSTPFDTISINSARFNLAMVSTGTNGQGCMIQLNTSEHINVDAEL